MSPSFSGKSKCRGECRVVFGVAVLEIAAAETVDWIAVNSVSVYDRVEI